MKKPAWQFAAIPFLIVTVFVPLLLVWVFNDTGLAGGVAMPNRLDFWVGLASIGFGGALVYYAVNDFLKLGDGTPAPWDPPRVLVVSGLYRFVRNPMLIGLFFILLGEVLILGALAVAVWCLIVFVATLFVVPFAEERYLERRFGREYQEYKRNVPRWIPRLTPWP